MNELGWKSVPNPADLIRQIKKTADDTGCVVYVIPENMEWTDTFRAILETECQKSQRALKTVDSQQFPDTDPGELLLHQFVTHPTLAEGYRRSIGYARYLADADLNSGLGNDYIYVQNASGSTMQAWCRFIADYRKAHKPGNPYCCFLVECIADKPDTGKGMKVIDYHDCIRAFDTLIFCILASSGLSVSPLLQGYAAELAAALGSHDPELAALLIQNGEKLIHDPLTVTHSLLGAQCRSDGTAFSDQISVQEQIWRAQLKVFFPLIEQYRIQLVNRFSAEFPVHEEIIGTFGQHIDDICDIDLGTFKLLCDSGRMHIPNADYKTMCFYRDCRNLLAHTEVLSYQQIERLTLQ